MYRLLVSKKVISKTQDYDRVNLLRAKLLCKYSWVTKIISFSLETNGYSRVKTKNSHLSEIDRIRAISGVSSTFGFPNWLPKAGSNYFKSK